MLHVTGTTAPDSVSVELFYINEGFSLFEFVLQRFKHPGEMKTFNLLLPGPNLLFPRLPCNLSLCDPLMLHVQQLLHLLITGSIVPDNSAPARLQSGSASPDRVSLLPPKPEELITFSSR